MPGDRPDPDALLERVQRLEAASRRGRLKVFFGATAGVGKTYAMLEAARRERAAGRDTVVGLCETHGRADAAALLEGFEVLPKKKLEYRGHALEELDLDRAIARRPSLLLVDELAHTNVPGARHEKRWQDVRELCDAGIEVWTTLNVQHLESLNDVIAQITGVRVRETLPDAVFEEADEVELVDLPPEVLIERLREGKVYLAAQAKLAEEGFFRRGNLLALRELALRRTAEQIDADVLEYRRDQGIEQTWAVAEHILVCVGPSPLSATLVRAGRRMAFGLRAKLTVATVETPGTRLSAADRARVARHLRLAEQLGAEVVGLHGERISSALLTHARSSNVTRIVIGKPTHPRWRDVLFGSLLDEVVRGSGDIDVHVISGEEGEEPGAPERRPAPPQGARGYVAATLVVGLTTALDLLVYRGFELSDVAMVYVLGIVVVASRFGRGPSATAAALSVLAFDFAFVPPRFTFAVSDYRYFLTFATMLIVGLVVSSLTLRVRRQAESASAREHHTAALYALTRELAGARSVRAIAQVAVRDAGAAFGARVAVLLPDGAGHVRPLPDLEGALELDERETVVASWAFEHGEPAGLGTSTLPAAKALHSPLVSAYQVVGVLSIQPTTDTPVLAERRQLLDAFCHKTAMALERARLLEEGHAARLRAERESLRNALLSSVSHDLRTPLAAITGAASTLLEDDTAPLDVRREMLQTVFDEADRLNRLVGNLLDMTRLEAGDLRVKKEWMSLEEVIGTALHRLERTLHGRPVAVDLPADLPLVAIDGRLVGQVFVNLLENAAKHTPQGTPIEIAARASDKDVCVEISDRGPGVDAGEEERVFEKFYRARGTAGTGLGLAIARGVVIAHGGRIEALARDGGGATFRFTLPLGGVPPTVPAEPAPSSERAA
jgi:two-component system sensor histidine kinase KdpD